jgi:hypothetical protein
MSAVVDIGKSKRSVTRGRWTTLRFGKHAGKTLPQVVLGDPDWFFWAVDHKIFRGALADEARELAHKACHIKIPKRDPHKWRVEYLIEADGLIRGFEIVPANGAEFDSFGTYLDLSYPRRLRSYDKLGYKLMLRQFRTYFDMRLNKKNCEEFFEAEGNFFAPQAGGHVTLQWA